MLGTIFGFELRYRLRRPATYIYLVLTIALGLLVTLTDVARINGSVGKVNVNAPFMLNIWIGLISTVLGFFIFSAILSVPVYRDFEHNIFPLLYSYPLKKKTYLGGRYLGSLLVAFVIIAGFPLGMMAGEVITKLKGNPDELANYGPLMVSAYVLPLFTIVLPNLIALGSVYFAIPTLSRKIFFTYVLSISVLVLYSLSNLLLTELYQSGYKDLARLIDPFGFRAFQDITEYWSIAEKNHNLVPLEGVFLWNRVLWTFVGLCILAYTFFKFEFSVSQGAPSQKTEEDHQELAGSLLSAYARPGLLFDFGARLAQFRSLVSLELKSTIKNPFFLVFVAAIGLYCAMDIWYADSTYGTDVYPVTSVMLDQFSNTYFLLLNAMMIFLAGEVVFRERQYRIDQLYNTLPIPLAIPYLAKFLALVIVPIIMQGIVILIMVSVQTLKGYYDYEFGLYLTHAYLVSFPQYLLLTILAFVIQVTVNNKFIGHGVMLGVLCFFSFGIASQIGLEHPLWDFGSGLGLTYSDMAGYGDELFKRNIFLLHWFIVASIMLLAGYAFVVGGVVDGPKARFQIVISRFRSNTLYAGTVFLLTAAMLGSGFYIYYQTTQVDTYRTEKESEELQVSLEKRFKHIADLPKPKVTNMVLRAELYPESHKLEMSGRLTLKNKTAKRIDTLYVNTNSEATVWEQKFSVPVTKKSLGEDVDQEGFFCYVFNKGLAPGDSFYVDYKAVIEQRGFNNRSGVRTNGTFLNLNGNTPSFGYPGFELQDEDKRREYGLKPLPPQAPVTDSVALNRNAFEDDADYTNFEIIVGTAQDQIAIAPGYLQRKWTEQNRAYFHYKMDKPIDFFANISSARYQVTKEEYKGISLEVYHLPQHSYNVPKMLASLKASLDYYQANYTPYQFRQVRILEFPRLNGSFAQSFANTIPYSESIGFIARIKDEDDIDYVTYVTAHEMSHQWWGHQILPADVRGAQFLSETMSQYSALMVMLHHYGLGMMRKFLRYELRSYLTGRSSEKEREKSLLDVESQSYTYYRKGSVVMFGLQDYIGETVFNKAVGKYIKRYALTGPPFPHARAFYDTLKNNVPVQWHGLLEDQLEKITLFENRVIKATGKVIDAKAKTYQVDLEISTGKFYADSVGNSNEKPYAVGIPLDFGLLSKENPTQSNQLLLIEKRPVAKVGKSSIRLQYKGEKPVFAGIDPLNKLVDRNTDDNVARIDWE